LATLLRHENLPLGRLRQLAFTRIKIQIASDERRSVSIARTNIGHHLIQLRHAQGVVLFALQM